MTECWKGIIKWTRNESWKFLTEFLILSEQQISTFSSTLLSGIFYHFRRVNSDISKGWMIMVVINWLKLLPVSEKSFHNFFNLKGDSVLPIILGCAYKNTTGWRTYAVLWICWGTYTHSRSGWTQNFGGTTNHLTRKFPRKKFIFL